MSPNTASTPNGARPRGAARREALLDAVLRVVAEVGVDAVTHRRVAEEAGLPLASTTYWFQSKEHLLTAALQSAADRDIERLRAFVSESPERAGDPVGAAVGAILGPTEDSAKAPRPGAADNLTYSSRAWLLATYALVLEAARRPALREVTTRWTEAYMEALSPLLAAAGSRHPRSDSELLLAAADGLLIEQLASGDASAKAPPPGAADNPTIPPASGAADLSTIAPRLRRLADALVKS